MSFTPTEEQNFKVFQDTNNLAAEFAHHAINFAFYLNGAAATAILAAGKTEFYPAALWMGSGAACAVACMGLAYLYMLVLGETWRQKETEKDGVKGFYYPVWNSNVFLSTRATEKLRLVPIGLWLLSMVLFFIGVGFAGAQFF